MSERLIRPATGVDAPRVFDLIRELAVYEHLEHQLVGDPESLAQHIDEGICWAFVCEVEGAVVGYALGVRTYSTFRTQQGTWLEDLYVTPTHRGAGHGKALLLHVQQIAINRGDGRYEWNVLDWNEPSIRFYQAMGANLLSDWRLCRIEFERKG